MTSTGVAEPVEGEPTGGPSWGHGPRTRVRRHPERALYDRATIEGILDEGFVCHLGFSTPDGPVVLPTAYARRGADLYLHGAAANHTLRTIGDGAPVCLTVTLVDGIVLARSAFNHSINYRSVVVYGHAYEVRDAAEKRAALDAVVEHIVPGRTRDARGANEAELRATRVVRVVVDEASAKVRAGGPKDDPEDVAAGGVWAGHLPLRTTAGAPVADGAVADRAGADGAGADGAAQVAPPAYVTGYRRPGPAPSGAGRAGR